MNRPPNIRKIAALLVLGVGLFVAARVAFYYLTTAPVSIDAKGAKTITINRLTYTTKTYSEQGSDHFTARLKGGMYAVTASRDDTTTKQTIIVVARQPQHVTVSLKTIGTIEPVSPRSTLGFAADPAGLVYLDSNNENLYRVGIANVERLIDTPVSFTSSKWADSQFGVAQTEDGSLYTINGSTVQKLALPSNNPLTGYAITKNRQIFITYTTKLYKSSGGTAFRIVATPTITYPKLLAVNDSGGLLLQDDVSTPKNDDPVFTISTLTKDGLSQKQRFAIGHTTGFQTAWSPDGSKLLVGTPSGTTITDAKLNIIVHLPNNTVRSPVWITDDMVAYGLSNQVWAYNLTNRSSYVLGTTYNQQSISAVYSGNDASNLYVSFQNSSTGQQLGRLNIANPQKNAQLQSLGIILPNSVAECSFGYINFTRPTVIAYGPDAFQQDCTQKAAAYLESFKAQLGGQQLPIVFSSGS